MLRKIRVTCRTWQHVLRLCEQQSAGRNHLTLRGAHKLQPGERLTIALQLPDELVLAIGAEVAAVHEDPIDGSGVFSISLSGLTPEVCVRLRSMCSGAAPARGSGRYVRVGGEKQDAGPEPEPGTGQVLGNLKLRRQIDELGKKLKN